MYYMDIYGQPIQFTYKKSAVFGTICGLVTSFIVIVVILIYTVLYSFDLARMEVPIVLNVPQYSNHPYHYEFTTDINGISGNDSDPELYKDNSNKDFLQIMIGIHDKKNFIELNSQIAILEVVNELGQQMFIDNCKRMPFVGNDSFERYQLNKTYCLYSPFTLEGDSISQGNYSYLEIRLKLCQEGYEIKTLKDLDSYKLLKNQFPSINLDETKTKPIYTQPSEGANLNCVADPAVEVSKLDLYFLYVNSIFNQTNSNVPIVRIIDWKSFQLSGKNQATVSAYFQINRLTSFTNIMPKSMTNFNISDNYASFDDDKYSIIPNTIDESAKVVASIRIQSSEVRNQYERTYQNLFDILGKIGGFSKIVLLIGSIFVFYGAKIRLRESLINDFYSVVDPINMDKVNKDFNKFLQEIKDGSYHFSKDEKVAKNEKVLCDFYKNDDFVTRLLVTQTKINKNQIEAAEKAEYNSARIVYQLYINVLYSGLHYDNTEILANLFCSCCPTKRLKEKNIVFRKAVKALEKDTDFLSILGCVQNFETIKATFLKKETQLSLFKALANKPFASSTIMSEMKKKKDIDKNEGSLNIETLFNNLRDLTRDEKKTFEDLKWDEKLVSNLVEDKHKESADNLINNMKEIIQEREDKKHLDNNKMENAKILSLTKEDYEKINKKFE